MVLDAVAGEDGKIPFSIDRGILLSRMAEAERRRGAAPTVRAEKPPAGRNSSF